MHQTRGARRPGMTLIEVLFAIVIMSGVMLSLSRFGQAFSRAQRNSAYLTVASDLAAARLEVVRGHRTYLTLVSTFNATTETSATGTANPAMTGYSEYTRVTSATRTQTDSTDYVTVTVSVSAAMLTSPVSKTAVISRY